ncbi:response regulator transcription factor [Rubneribacter sp.]
MSSIRKDAPAFLGGGLLWAWSFLFFFSQPPRIEGITSLQGDLLYLGGVLVVSLFCAALPKRFGELQHHLWLAWAGCGLIVAGTSTLAVLNVAGERFSLGSAHAVAEVLVGLGQGGFWIAWGEAMAKRGFEGAETTMLRWTPVLAASFVIASLMRSTFDMPLPLLALAGNALPICSLVCFLKLTGDPAFGVSGAADIPSETQEDEAPRPYLARHAKRLCSIGCVFTAISFVWNSFFSHNAVNFEECVLLFALGSALSTIIMLKVIDATKRFDLTTLYQWSLPALILGVAFMQFPGKGSAYAAFICLICVNVGFEIMSKLYFVHLAQRNRSEATRIIALGFSMGTTGGMAGTLFEKMSSELGNPEISFGCIIMTLFFFALMASMTQSAEQADVAERRNPIGGEEAESDLARRCGKVSQRFKLSQREQDVLFLLAQGRSRTYIREALFISKGTVDTHIHHIYAKVGVSSKNELLSMILDG